MDDVQWVKVRYTFKQLPYDFSGLVLLEGVHCNQFEHLTTWSPVEHSICVSQTKLSLLTPTQSVTV